ncbi:septum site-determining protein MinC [Desulfitobacterium dichloroeliminans LMG P-21439]|uniref:Probable septum site-determining protein MinC n=1 Tax=Desulfitobacterium dichloroeliminans (strain LMG P-21439 / DCA1) TaxID=871963 RepID=L0FBS2_DESDL|nr:septum site-determining protein MinC [Desulfitobacterium dichloroeliminans]AGA70465.1 septum site-determining protein MinC [Desulfitobacterium dichloroeliminans LMG P-21439]
MTRTEHIALKGTREGLILYLDPEADFSTLMDELKKLLDDSDHFLQGAAVRCYAGEKEYTPEQQEKLMSCLTKYSLAFNGWLTSAEVYSSARKTPSVQEVEPPRVMEEGMVEGPSLFVERTLRSGASIQYDGHVIVVGDVNPGAEIVARGNIVVIGSLKGVAHAGATGDRTATVIAYHLAPTQLRIADLVTRSPEDELEWRGPECARIKGDRLVVEGIQLNGLRGKRI